MGGSAAADVKGTCIPKCLGRAGELIRTRNLENAPPSSEKAVTMGGSAAADVEGMYVLQHATPT